MNCKALCQELGIYSGILEDEWSRNINRLDIFNLLKNLGWRYEEWLQRRSETDPTYRVRITMRTGNVVLIHSKPEFPDDNVCNEFTDALKRLDMLLPRLN